MRETVGSWLKKSVEKLRTAEIESAKLDSELILARVLKVRRTKLHANPQKKLSKTAVFHANNFLNKRARRIPLAYIFHEKDFFGRTFFVNENILVPRPETETLIEITKKYAKNSDKILDIGTGSGIIPITLKAELGDEIEVFASDISVQALAIANLNAQKIVKILNFSKVTFWSRFRQKHFQKLQSLLQTYLMLIVIGLILKRITSYIMSHKLLFMLKKMVWN